MPILAAALAGAIVVLGLAWLSIPALLGRLPVKLPLDHLPAPALDLLQRLQPEPRWDALPQGPVLAAARQRGVLVVGVREYARPALPGAPNPPGPDGFDAGLAGFLGAHLQVPVKLVGLGADGRAHDAPAPVPDLIIAGARPGAAGEPRVPSPYAGGTGRLVALRGSPYTRAADLAQRPVCVAQGSPYVQELASRYHAVPVVHVSAIRAIAAFMAGECQALAEDKLALARLAGLPEWRFYAVLDQDLDGDAGAQIGLRQPDPASAAYLDRAVRYWVGGGGLARAREQRAGDLAYQAGELQSGLVCHA
ncbi:ABC transporter substrate-binding protein [Cupriavidus sp. 30B13]|uniref:ABC transporter substrate-binding protein n=1 Tax=Cupriavidus sp. 30B13 TaxID=3384241 RepID=UPI003B9087EE